MPDGLYETDALAWAEQQSDLLSRLAAGERLNAAVDWEHVVEEIRDVGISELHRCESLLTQAIIHLFKLHLWPASQAAIHWRRETGVFLVGAKRHFTTSMRQRIDVASLYADAVRVMLAGGDIRKESLPGACPLEFDALLASDIDVEALVARIGTDHV